MSSCIHHWLLESPDGPNSHGRCKLCGEERDFPNWIAGYNIFKEPISAYGSYDSEHDMRWGQEANRLRTGL